MWRWLVRKFILRFLGTTWFLWWIFFYDGNFKFLKKEVIGFGAIFENHVLRSWDTMTIFEKTSGSVWIYFFCHDIFEPGKKIYRKFMGNLDSGLGVAKKNFFLLYLSASVLSKDVWYLGGSKDATDAENFGHDRRLKKFYR